jgi:Bacterial membrane protein YfhO
MKINNLKNHLIALGVFIVAILIFCAPVFKGKVLASHDFVSYLYISHEATEAVKDNGGSVYWTNSMFGGMPTQAGSSGNLLADWLFGVNNNAPRPLTMFLLALISFYVLASAFRWKTSIRIFASIAFAFSTYNPILTAAGHDTKLYSIAFAAGLMGALFFVINGRKFLGLALATIFSALLFTSAHYQIIYYAFILLFILAIVSLIKAAHEKALMPLIKNYLLIGICVAIGMLPTLKSMLLMKDYTAYTMRGGNSELTIGKTEKKTNGGLDLDYAFRWSNGIGETFAAIIPGLYGPLDPQVYAEGKTAEKIAELQLPNNFANQLYGAIPGYWGPQPFISGPVYFGAIVVFLFILSLLIVRSHYKWWVLIGSILFIMLSWGINFSSLNVWLFHHLPMYNKFRTPSMALTMPQILFPFFAAWALHELTTTLIDKKELLKKVFISGGIVLSLILILGFGASISQSLTGTADKELKAQLAKSFGGDEKVNILYTGIKADRASFIMQDSIHALVFIALAFAIIFLLIKQKINNTIGIAILAVLSFVDLYMIANRYMPEDRYYVEKDEYEQKYFAPRAVDQQILQDKDPYYRVQDLTVSTYNDAKPAFFHKLIGGYHPVKMESFQDLIDVQLSKNNKEVYNMLNCKYFIVPGGQQQGQETIMPNRTACGNAWFVNEIKLVKNADEEMLALNAPSLSDTTSKGDFVASKTAIVRDTFKASFASTTFAKDSSAKIKLDKYGLQELNYTSNNSNAGFAVFSDVYYPVGWTATIDGKETPIIKTDYLLRGINVPAGKHAIAFNYMPPNAKKYHTLASLGSFLVLGLFAFLLFLGFKKNEGEEIIAE